MRWQLVLGALVLGACAKPEQGEMVARDPEPPRGSQAWKVRSARSAAPADIAMDAAVVDWPANDSVEGARLVIGGNGWTCFPDDPRTPVADPFCADDVMMQWFEALLRHERPRITAMGVAYLLQGGASASDTDPFKTAPDSGQEWLVEPPTIAIAMPDPRRSFAGLPATRMAAGPWVMFAGTPYAHLMVPVAR